jgi:hypothetical protein
VPPRRSVPLDSLQTAQSVESLLAQCQGALEEPPFGDGGGGVHQLLLPPRSGDGPRAAAFGGDDARLLAAIVDETRAVLSGPSFAAAARAALQEGRLQLCASLAPALAADAAGRPLAKLVPAMAAAAEAVLQPPPLAGGVAVAIARLPIVDAFCADVFSKVN